jgi:hypothetical protein
MGPGRCERGLQPEVAVLPTTLDSAVDSPTSELIFLEYRGLAPRRRG